jgi:hypothetical protein
MHDTKQVRTDDPGKLLLCDFTELGIGANGRVGDHHIQPAEPLAYDRGQPLHVGEVRHVGGEAQAVRSDTFGSLLDRVSLATRNDDAGAAFDEFPRNGGSDPGACSGDDGYFESSEMCM